jgi:hypothetical protein
MFSFYNTGSPPEHASFFRISVFALKTKLRWVCLFNSRVTYKQIYEQLVNGGRLISAIQIPFFVKAPGFLTLGDDNILVH